MYGFPRPAIPNDVQWNSHRASPSPPWRQFSRPRVPFHPRNQSYSMRPPMHGGSEEHWCETCDRGFPNVDLLSKHKQQHQKCNIDGCQFIAHPKVITKHIQMQHSSGLYKKIAKLNNPEEIDKWREERRKKYPTKINIDKKAAELKEKIDRGEKMNLGRKDWHNKRDEKSKQYQNSNNNSGQGMKRPYNNHDNNQPFTKFRKTRKQKPKILPAPEENRSIAPFAGIQCLEMNSDEEVDETLDCDDLIQDDDIGKMENDLGAIENDKSLIVEKPVVCSALSSLMCEYGSSDEEIDEIETKQNFKDKGICKGDISMSQIKGTEQSVLLQTSKENSKVLPEKDRNINKTGKNGDIGQKLPNQNNAGIGTESCEVFPTNPNSNVLAIKNVDTNEEASKSEVKVPKNENDIRSDITSKSDELVLSNNDKLDPCEKNNANIYQDDNDSGPEEMKVDRNDESAQENKTDKIAPENNADNKMVKKKVEVVRRKPIYRKPKPKLPSTLIYRLLSNEMKHERNQVLQCIRYIRKNNYFAKNST